MGPPGTIRLHLDTQRKAHSATGSPISEKPTAGIAPAEAPYTGKAAAPCVPLRDPPPLRRKLLQD